MDLMTTILLIILSVIIALLFVYFFVKKEKEDIQIEDALLGSEELERHAKETARNHIVGDKKGNAQLLIPRVNQNFEYITCTYKALCGDIRKLIPTVSAAEWLLDNHYIIEEQIKDIRHCIAEGYYRGLPILKSGYWRGYPRAYAIALEIVSHTDGVIDEKGLIHYISSYQSQSLLSMGEIWALAPMVRIALVEKTRQLCEKIMQLRSDWEAADQMAELIASSKNYDRMQLTQLFEDKLNRKLSTSYIEHLLQNLRKRGIKGVDLLQYLDEQLAESNMTTEKAAELEHHLQAAWQISIGNSITSLRSVSALDWNDVFESLSHVEHILRQDPSDVYIHMDFESRDYYRHTVEEFAKACKTSEINIARSAVDCAVQAKVGPETENNSPLKHVGYYLVGKGKETLRRKSRGCEGIDKLSDSVSKNSAIYFGITVFLTLFIASLYFYYTFGRAHSMKYAIGVLTVLAVLIPVSDFVITLINIIISHTTRPRTLPKLELKEGVPVEAATMVIIPTLLPNEKRARELIDQLEVIYLSNRDENIFFSLVGDFKDAPRKETGDDRIISNTALEGVKKLNERYPNKNANRFFYFHRCRTYNEGERKWMGWERKRGAIIEFNELVRGSHETTYSIVSGEIDRLPRFKYIITLDADTSLPIGEAKRLVGTISHPLNRAIVDSSRGIVTEGYGLLQPRINISITSANSTLFSRIFAGEGGIDPYTFAISDVYQDLFGEGIFTGKGIYDLDIFQRLLKDAIPDNTVLSHDLLEGSYIRTGLVTDIEMMDGYPARYNASSMRLHRWVRGDWQLLPWIFGHVKNRQGKLVRNPLTLISKWKIADNMRRSLINPALLLIILLGLSILPGNGLVWVGLAVFTASTPLWSYLLNSILSVNFKFGKDKRHTTIISGFRASLYQTLLNFIFIPYQAYLMGDAIIKTISRMHFTHRNMLEWVTAADMEANLKNNVSSFWRRMWVSTLFGVIVVALSVMFMPSMLPVAVLLLVIWAISPYVAYVISKPYVKKKETLSSEEILRLRSLARKTWAYYEDFAGEEDHYLPPDNFQEEPTRIIAHRTSPTNIGFLLIGIVSARDLGFIGNLEMLRRIDQSLSTIERLEKWNGHLYNWYDTLTLSVLRPHYVSTVDSGNLIGYLMVLEKALEEYMKKPAVDVTFAYGLMDLIRLSGEEREDRTPPLDMTRLEKIAAEDDVDFERWGKLLENLTVQIDKKGIQEELENLYWGRKLIVTINAFRIEIKQVEKLNARLKPQFEDMIHRVKVLIEPMEFRPLFDFKRQLFSIGYNVEEGRLTKSYYDLLASEARLASYIAVARGEVDQRHWVRLGRKLASIEGYKGLVSWTGTMFEYLMPMLLMKTYDNTLLAETYSFVVKNQQRYGEQRNIPWGVSESGYYSFDIALNYQYKAFGVPELGLKNGMENDIVVAPYATILAIGIDPAGTLKNIKRLEAEGMLGLYGFYEATDYTPTRLQRDEKCNIVKSFMAHHQGMNIVALNNFINQNVMQTRFHANPMIRSAELLLQERVPSRVTFTKEQKEVFMPSRKSKEAYGDVVRSYGIPDTHLPHAHILSNGGYSVVITNGGGGFSKVHDTAISRWSRDFRGISRGMFIFIQNLNSNNVWSAAYEPLNSEPEKYRAIFSPDKAEFIRKDGNIETHTEITVSPEENAEIRRVTLTNYSQHARELELTSYFEVLLTHLDADIAHPAFSNLFIRTEYIEEYNCLIASRRPRSENQKPMWAIHSVAVEGEVLGDIHYETDRLKFIGRNRDISDPLVLDVNQPLSNTVGPVLDPIMSLRRRVRVESGKSVNVNFIVAVADSYKKALELADKYHEPRAASRAFELAWTRSQIESEYLGLKSKDAKTYLDMIPPILFVSPKRRSWSDILEKNKKGQPDLWPYGISGDVPVVLLSIGSQDEIEMVHWLLRAHEFWRMKGLLVDLVILLKDENSYIQPLQDACRDAAAASHARELIDKRGGVFIRNAKQMPEEDVTLLYTVARIALEGSGGPVEEQLKLTGQEIPLPNVLDHIAAKAEVEKSNSAEVLSGVSRDKKITDLTFYNGLGGFSPDGREYVINVCGEQHTPAPWINVISNPGFGFNVSESGSGFTWSENSRENKLTPWSNDPVSDPPGEVFYLRDENRGGLWSITPEPIREETTYIVRHGMGYTVFEHTSHDIEQQLTLFCPMNHPVKIGLVKLRNLSEEERTLTLTYYIRPVLGVNDQVTAQFITTSHHAESGVFLIENNYNSEFKGRIAFIGTSENPSSYTGDRAEFLGINGSIKDPEALRREHLSGRLGAGYDPCVALQLQIVLPKKGEKELVILLGQGKEISEVISITSRMRQLEEVKKELECVKEFWREKLGAIQVSTPDPSMNLLLNGWLLYQTISCRLWSRSAFYQSGGAYGFRDQLQDVMAAVYSWPEIIRQQILLHSAHQYKEGDVQHWWHAEAGKGIRTKYSDDLVWLAYVTADYIENTGDWSILDEETGYLESEPLEEHEDERYEIPKRSEEKSTLYEHCLRVLDRSLKVGEHGIPLMGSGDWNDGMNTVGNKGKGESVWLGWFIYTTLKRFIPLCEKRGDLKNLERYNSSADKIAEAIEKNAWDGSWYKRAFFDDGKPLGSSINSECQIDSISQSWAVISGAGRSTRIQEAMNAVSRHLIDYEDGLIKLLTPPFDKGDLKPGYIKGYVPGVRENGGQYTHASVWVIIAFAKMGMGDKSWEMFHLINPINHSRTPIEYNRYKAEPYVMAADVYAVPPHNGRGGWSWYTGAAGWMYRAGIEHILGFKKMGNSLRIDPCIPREWKEFSISYRYGKTSYNINVVNPTGVNTGVRSVTVDDGKLENGIIQLQDDGKQHVIKVDMGINTNRA